MTVRIGEKMLDIWNERKGMKSFSISVGKLKSQKNTERMASSAENFSEVGRHEFKGRLLSLGSYILYPFCHHTNAGEK